MTMTEMRNKRAALIGQARSILDLAGNEKRGLLGEEQTAYDRIMGEVDGLEKDIERHEKLAAVERSLGESTGTVAARSEVETREVSGNEPEYRAAFDRFMRTGVAGPELQKRALQADIDTAGGYAVTPVQMVRGILKAMDNAAFVRQFATVWQVPNADALGVPTVAANPEAPDWTGEITAVDEDTAMTFGNRELHPHMLTKLLKVSMKLLNRVPDVESLVTERLGYMFGITAENAYLNGSGANQPLGVFTASNNGIPTTRDVATGNLQTAVTYDGLIECKYALKGQYWPRARWIFNRAVLKTIAKLKDGEGRYIWQPGQSNNPDTLLDMPVHMSEYAPSTMTNGLYVGILGDFSYYWIADAMNMTIQRLVELYAGTNQVGFIGRLSSDGMPVMSEAFARVTLAP